MKKVLNFIWSPRGGNLKIKFKGEFKTYAEILEEQKSNPKKPEYLEIIQTLQELEEKKGKNLYKNEYEEKKKI